MCLLFLNKQKREEEEKKETKKNSKKKRKGHCKSDGAKGKRNILGRYDPGKEKSEGKRKK